MPSLKAALALDETAPAVTRKNWTPPKPSYCSPKPSAGPTLIIRSAYADGLFDDDDDDDDDVSDDDAMHNRHPYLGSYDAPLVQTRRRSSDKSVTSPLRSLAKASKILGTDLTTAEHLSHATSPGRTALGTKPKSRFDSGSNTSHKSTAFSLERVVDSPVQRSSDESHHSARLAALPTTPDKPSRSYSRSAFEDWEDGAQIASPDTASPSRFWSRASRTLTAPNIASPIQSPLTPLRRKPRRPPASDIITTRPPFYKSPSSQTDVTASSPDSVVEVLAYSDDEALTRPGHEVPLDAGREREMPEDGSRLRALSHRTRSPSLAKVKPSSLGRRGSAQPSTSHAHTEVMKRTPSDMSDTLRTIERQGEANPLKIDPPNRLTTSSPGPPRSADNAILSFDPNRRPRAPFPASQSTPAALSRAVMYGDVSPLSKAKILEIEDALPPCPDRMHGIQQLVRPRAVAQPLKQAEPARPPRTTDGNIFEGLQDSPLRPAFQEQRSVPVRGSSRPPTSRLSKQRPARLAPPSHAPPATPATPDESDRAQAMSKSPPSPADPTQDEVTPASVQHYGDPSRVSLLSPDKAKEIIDALGMRRPSPVPSSKSIDDTCDAATAHSKSPPLQASHAKSFDAVLLKVDRQKWTSGTAPQDRVVLDVGGLQFASKYDVLASESDDGCAGLSRWLKDVVNTIDEGSRLREERQHLPFDHSTSANGRVDKLIAKSLADIMSQSDNRPSQEIEVASTKDAEMLLPDSPTLCRGVWQPFSLTSELSRPSETRDTQMNSENEDAKRVVSMSISEDDSTFDEAFNSVVVRRDTDTTLLTHNGGHSIASQVGGASSVDEVDATPSISSRAVFKDHRRSCSATAADLEASQVQYPWAASSKHGSKGDRAPILSPHRRLSIDSAHVPRSVKSQSVSGVSSIYDGSEGWADEERSVSSEASVDGDTDEHSDSVRHPSTTDTATTADEQTPTALATRFDVKHATSTSLQLHIRLTGRNPLWYPTILHALEHDELPEFLTQISDKDEDTNSPTRQMTLRAVQRESLWLGYPSVATLCQARLASFEYNEDHRTM